MKEWQGTLSETNLYQLDQWYSPQEVLLFDIETTGFSANTSLLYMIGFCYYQDGNWHYRMLFNDDGRSELSILEAFQQIIEPYSTLIHYNGDGFDLPFLTDKYHQYQQLGVALSGDKLLETKESIDLYKEIKPYRNGFKLPNLKLVTIEAALGRTRKDTETGGTLIPLYKSYIKNPTYDLEQRLFQHNYDDILAMIPLLQLLNYRCLVQQDWKITQIQETDEDIQIQLELDYPIPLPLNLDQPDFHCNILEQKAQAIIPIYTEKMRYYIPNWKDYYYLPMEERVIHKSVAEFVNPEFKERAKKQNCFLEKEGRFIPCPAKILNWEFRTFKKKDIKGPSFLELEDISANQTEFWLEYLRYILYIS